MGVTYNKNFFEKVKSISNVAEFLGSETMRNKIANAVAEEGVEIARQMYAGTDINVISTPASDGKAEILANGSQVAYMEFGTGEYAKGTYEGDLPQSGVPITVKWEYYYPSKSKVTVRSGSFGWYHNKKFHVGQKAGSQMWRTAIETKKNIRRIAQEVIEKEIKGI